MGKKVTLEKEKKVLEDSATEKDAILQKKIKTIGNYVHDSVPVSDNEVCLFHMKPTDTCFTDKVQPGQ